MVSTIVSQVNRLICHVQEQNATTATTRTPSTNALIKLISSTESQLRQLNIPLKDEFMSTLISSEPDWGVEAHARAYLTGLAPLVTAAKTYMASHGVAAEDQRHGVAAKDQLCGACGACFEYTGPLNNQICKLNAVWPDHVVPLHPAELCSHVAQPIAGFFFCNLACIHAYNWEKEKNHLRHVMPHTGVPPGATESDFQIPARMRPGHPAELPPWAATYQEDEVEDDEVEDD